MEVGEFSCVLELAEYAMQAYEKMCRPLCQELGMAQTGFDILMFLANHPQYQTARDIVSVRRLKANLVSFHVEKLVQEGYLVRRNVQGDRRKIALICTQKAQPVIRRGREVQELFQEKMMRGISPEMLEVMRQMVERTKENVEQILAE